MKSGKLTALAIAALLAAPLPAYAGGDKASSSKGSTSSAAGKSSDNGAEAMFKSLDKNKDGNLTMAEVKGTPHEKEFKQLDKNHDGKLSRTEHAAAPEHQAKASAAGGSSAPKDSSSSGSAKK